MLEKISSFLGKKKLLPNQQEDFSPPQGIEKIIAVAAGKGGVGKSATAATLAFLLASHRWQVGILDADIYGPSMSLIFKNAQIQTGGADAKKVSPKLLDGIKVISAGMFAPKDKAQVLRGPIAANLVKQFYTEVAWGDLHHLIIDMPPGTGDIQLTLAQSLPITGSIIVTTPEEMATNDVEKAIQMFHLLNIPILGIVETMSFFTCDQCDKKHKLFPGDGGEKLANKFGIPLLARIPFDPLLNRALDEGKNPLLANPTSASIQAYSLLMKEVEERLRNQPSHERLSSFQLDWRS